ncbi:MAG: rRNA maturation RNase YbeY [Gammaproteobacteria bacterium]|nr:rRNA maturation RNase YbeY [Gammaproteobacteria bacterium]
MAIAVEIQRACRVVTPTNAELRRWLKQAIQPYRDAATVTVRIVDEVEGSALNKRWRGKTGPTNVLAFPLEGLETIAPDLLGDIVVCAPVAAAEAEIQHKTLKQHWAHLIVHGALHLLGFDHLRRTEARAMEAVERHVLADLGYPDPY